MNCAERGEKELETNKVTRPREGIGCSKHGCKFAWNVDGTRKHESYGLSRTIPYSRIGDSMLLRLTEEVILEYRRRRVRWAVISRSFRRRGKIGGKKGNGGKSGRGVFSRQGGRDWCRSVERKRSIYDRPTHNELVRR